MVENLPAMQETWVQCRRHPGSGRSPGEGNGNPLEYSCLENYMDRGAWWATVHGVAKSQTLLSHFHLGFPGGSLVKNLPANAGDGKISGLGRSPGGGNDNLFQYSCLGHSMDRGVWWATVHRVVKESDMTKQLSMHTRLL